MGRKLIDISGKINGKFIVIGRSKREARWTYWDVKCSSCGHVREMTASGFWRAQRCPKCDGMRTDLTNHRTRHLTVLSFDRSENWIAYWLCRCDCGNEVVLPASRLTGSKAQASCGRCQFSKSRVPDEMRIRSRQLLSYKNGAKQRSLSWRLTDEEAWVMMLQPCYWCGSQPALREFWKTDERSRTIKFACNGIDRKDSDKGYTKLNTVPCCGICNRMKRDWKAVDFVDRVVSIANHMGLLKDVC